VDHISIYLSQLGFADKEDYMRVWNFPLYLTGIVFAWFTSLPWCTIGSWCQLEEQFYEYFRKTNEKRPITIESSAKIGLLVGIKERFDSDVSKVRLQKPNNTISFPNQSHIRKQFLLQKSMKNDRNQRDLIFQELKGLYIYLVITTSLMEIKPLQATKEGCVPAQNWLSWLWSRLSRLLPALSQLGRLPSRLTASVACSESARPTVPSRPSRLPLTPALSRLGWLPLLLLFLLVPKSA
jgi:hypothetical protein